MDKYAYGIPPDHSQIGSRSEALTQVNHGGEGREQNDELDRKTLNNAVDEADNDRETQINHKDRDILMSVAARETEINHKDRDILMSVAARETEINHGAPLVEDENSNQDDENRKAEAEEGDGYAHAENQEKGSKPPNTDVGDQA